MKTLISMILDQSGSMYPLTADTIGSFNNFVEEQKQVEGEACILTTLFNERVEIGPVTDIKEMQSLTYNAVGCTKMNDAIGMTIDRIGELFESKEISVDKTIVIIITDGLENASIKYSTEQVKQMIEHQKSVYNWEFKFLGANIDSAVEGTKRGIKKEDTQNFEFNMQGLQDCYASVSESVRSFRSH